MIVQELSLRNFRNHVTTDMEFGPGINVLLGANGQGKTNVLEAVSYLGLTKSFYAAGDQDVAMLGAETFSVEGKLKSDGELANTVRIAWRRDPTEKVVAVNGARPESLSSVIGRFPVVVLSPENATLTTGGPADRRKFVDLILSQISSAYLDDLLEFRRALRQRNRLLAEMRTGVMQAGSLLVPWTESLARTGGRITARRLHFTREFAPFIEQAYDLLAAGKERPAATYAACAPITGEDTPEALADLLLREMQRRAGEEQRRGLTVVGPHRDEIEFTLDQMSVQRFASQGQHKTLQVALKLAEYRFVRERRDETPMLLLDDLFSELDDARSRNILRVVQELGQTVITTTEETPFRGAVSWNNENRRFTVERGAVTRA